MSEFIGWLQQHSLAVDGTVDQSDTDGDLHNNYQEWMADTNPTNEVSFFRIESMNAGPPFAVQFLSSSNRLYTLFHASELADEPASPAGWAAVPGQSAVPGAGGLGELQDTNAAPRQFYRVGVSLP